MSETDLQFPEVGTWWQERMREHLVGTPQFHRIAWVCKKDATVRLLERGCNLDDMNAWGPALHLPIFLQQWVPAPKFEKEAPPAAPVKDDTGLHADLDANIAVLRVFLNGAVVADHRKPKWDRAVDAFVAIAIRAQMATQNEVLHRRERKERQELERALTNERAASKARLDDVNQALDDLGAQVTREVDALKAECATLRVRGTARDADICTMAEQLNAMRDSRNRAEQATDNQRLRAATAEARVQELNTKLSEAEARIAELAAQERTARERADAWEAERDVSEAKHEGLLRRLEKPFGSQEGLPVFVSKTEDGKDYAAQVMLEGFDITATASRSGEAVALALALTAKEAVRQLEKAKKTQGAAGIMEAVARDARVQELLAVLGRVRGAVFRRDGNSVEVSLPLTVWGALRIALDSNGATPEPSTQHCENVAIVASALELLGRKGAPVVAKSARVALQAALGDSATLRRQSDHILKQYEQAKQDLRAAQCEVVQMGDARGDVTLRELLEAVGVMVPWARAVVGATPTAHWLGQWAGAVWEPDFVGVRVGDLAAILTRYDAAMAQVTRQQPAAGTSNDSAKPAVRSIGAWTERAVDALVGDLRSRKSFAAAWATCAPHVQAAIRERWYNIIRTEAFPG